MCCEARILKPKRKNLNNTCDLSSWKRYRKASNDQTIIVRPPLLKTALIS